MLLDTLLPEVKRFGYKIELQFDNTPLVIDKNNYVTKILNVYIVDYLDYWPRSPLNRFTSKNCFLGATNIVKKY